MGDNYTESDCFTLDHGEEWIHDIILIPTMPGSGKRVSFLLYKEGDEEHQTLSLLIDTMK